MFASQIGPTGQHKGFLRPETAQGIFVNFRKLIEYNNDRMPFAAAQIGLGFRNEINPRQGLLRVREFQMAEIEHFVDPLNKDHPKFSNIADIKLPLLTANSQETTNEIISDLSMEAAVKDGVIGNQTMAYFMARTYQFLLECGIRSDSVRFRQHRCTEMAHYAQDCWDAEVETSYGYIEVAGHSDRSCFDLKRHADKTGVELNASKPLKVPIKKQYVKITIDKPKLGKTYKKDGKLITDYLDATKEEEKKELQK